jgi:hypothetical protein
MERWVRYEQKRIHCGKGSCWCAGTGPGGGHGPYWYAFWEEGPKTKCRYMAACRRTPCSPTGSCLPGPSAGCGRRSDRSGRHGRHTICLPLATNPTDVLEGYSSQHLLAAFGLASPVMSSLMLRGLFLHAPISVISSFLLQKLP